MDRGTKNYGRYLGGDDTAFEEIVREYKDGLMLYINSFTHDIFAAEEIMQEVFVRLAVKKPKFRRESLFKTWLYASGRNAAIDYIRRRSKVSDTSVEKYESVLHEEETVEKAYLLEERKIMLHSAIKKLKTEYLQVLYLVYFEEFSNEQTARIMKKSKRQVENLLYRAKSALKEKLEKEGFEYEIL